MENHVTRPRRRAALVGCLALCASIALTTPALADGVTHVVQSGEFLGSIAERHGVSVSQLREWNDLAGDVIYAGQELRVFPGAASGSRNQGYVVSPGDTVLGIAIAHDVSVDDLVAWNPGLNPDRIRVGQEINIRTTGRATRNVSYEVQPGDFVGRIAERHGVTVTELVAWNPGMDPDRIRVGDELRMVLRGPEVPSESVGRANDGRLVNGEQLPPHRAYTIRNLNRAWGTNETIGAIVDGFDYMRRRFDTLPRVPVHDLSDQDGGEISDHRSHQSGRDADIGYYHAGCRRDCAYRAVDPEDLDLERQWALLEYWIERDLVEYVFVDYEYQEVLYDWLAENGATREELREWFQYPRGRDVASGIIRHEPNHADHLHVRFACDPSDDGCR